MTRLLISQSIRQERWAGTSPGDPVKLLVLGEGGVGKSALVVKYLTRRFIYDYSKVNITYRHLTLVDDEPTLMDITDATSTYDLGGVSASSPRGSYSSRSSSGTPPTILLPSIGGNDYVNVPNNAAMTSPVSSPSGGGGGGDRIAGVDGCHVKSADGYMIVYSATDRRSFERASVIKRALDDAKKARHVSCVLVAAKRDLRDHALDHWSRRHSNSTDSNGDSDDGRIGMVSSEEGESVAGELACAFFETSSYASEGWKGIADAFDELCREVRRRKRMESKPARRKSSAQQIKNMFINKMFKTSHTSQNV